MTKYKAQLLMLIAAAGSIGAVTALTANADSGGQPSAPVVASPQPLPTFTMKPDNDEEIDGRCRFDAVFNGDGKDKNGGFAIQCRARFEIEREDNEHGKPGRDKDRRDDDFLRLECNGERIYSGDVKVRVKRDKDDHGDWDMLSGRDRDQTLVLKGRHGDPLIKIFDVDLRDKDKGRNRRDDNDDLRAILEYTNNGFSYRLVGRCDLDRDRKNDKPEWETLQ